MPITTPVTIPTLIPIKPTVPYKYHKIPTPPPYIPHPRVGQTSGGGGYSINSAKQYYLKTFTIPELYVALPTGLAIKPSKLGKRLAGLPTEQAEPEEIFSGMPGSEISVETPFGEHQVKVISKSQKIKAGTTQSMRTYRGRNLSGTTIGANI